jgi:tetratricopeptide (TPR) repeat protein
VRLVAGLFILAALAAPARADEAREEEARRLYKEGRAAFETHDWDTAYLRFRDAYMISQRPALLFNMASALKEGGRPSEAAETLRSYLRLVPDAPDKNEIQERILTLEESQRIMDREKQRKADQEAARRAAERAPPVLAPVVAPQPTPSPVVAPVSDEPARRARRRKIGLAVGLSVGGVVVIAVALGIAAGVSQDVPNTPGTLGIWNGTP